jgi:uncharacterized protein YdaU (DUF1376 family)
VTCSPRMPISVVEELAAASDLTAEEYGACLLLRLHQWQYGALPKDEDRLSRIAHVAADRWPAVASVIQPRFGMNWHHEATYQARQKGAATQQRLSEAGQKGGRSKRTAKPTSVPTAAQAASQVAGPALSRLKPNPQPSVSEASLAEQAGDQNTYPAMPDREAARAWLQERRAFPGDLDELQHLLVAGKLTPADLERSAP